MAETPVALNDDAMDDVSGGRLRGKWRTVYQVVRNSTHNEIVATFDTREEAEAFASRQSGLRVETENTYG